jgi:hypothetical protein
MRSGNAYDENEMIVRPKSYIQKRIVVRLLGVEQADDLERVVRTALRSIEAAEIQASKDESNRHIVDAIHQMAFAIEKLIAKMEEFERRCPGFFNNGSSQGKAIKPPS